MKNFCPKFVFLLLAAVSFLPQGLSTLGFNEICTANGFLKQSWVKSMNYGPNELTGFCTFVALHKKTYKSTVHVSKRLKVFVENQKLANELNSLDFSATYSAEQSPFGDLTPKEFKSTLLFNGNHAYDENSLLMDLDLFKRAEGTSSRSSFKQDQKMFRTVSDAAGNDREDKNFDWVEKGKVTKVKNQGTLGTCWAFSAVAVIESQVAIKHNTLADLSVEQLVECANDFNSTSGEADCAEFGGWPYLGFEYIKDHGGVYTESEFPYCSGTLDKTTMMPQCFPCMPKAYDKISCGDHSDLFCNVSSTKGQGPGGLCSITPNAMELTAISSWEKLSQDEEVLKTTLKEKGPISVAMSAMILQFYFGGIISLPLCSSSARSLDHALVLVGYGITDSYFGFDMPFWKVKNSWGPGWGEKGYFRLKRGSGMCGINLRPAIAYV